MGTNQIQELVAAKQFEIHMKRTYSFEGLPSPDCSESEDSILKRPKQVTSPQQHDFVLATQDALLEVFQPHSTIKTFTKLIPEPQKPLVVIFFGIMDSYLIPISKSIIEFQRKFNIQMIGVSANIRSNTHSFPVVSCPRISKALNVLDPMGGGVYPLDVIVVYGVCGKEKVRIPVMRFGRCVLEKPIVNILMEALEEAAMCYD